MAPQLRSIVTKERILKVHTSKHSFAFGEFIKHAPPHTTPQGNGACERANRSILSNLKRILADSHASDWDLFLPQAVYAYNTSVHSGTGHTPFFLMFGAEARTPAELIFGVPENPDPESPGSVAQTRYREMSQCYQDLRNKASERIVR